MIIYKATNLINGKIYIGQTIKKLEKRKNEHIRWAFNYNTSYIFHRALRKYGKENFNWEIIDIAKSIEELNEKEVYWIAFYNSYVYSEKCNGYNMTVGGGSTKGHKHSKETRKRISQSNLGKKQSEEQRRRNSENKRGSNHPNAKLTEEQVLEIKKLLENGRSLIDVATMFNVSYCCASSIKNSDSWTHVGDDISSIEYSKVTKSILTEDDVTEIKLLLKKKVKQKEIAQEFNVDPTTISSIKKGKIWSGVGDDLSNINYFKLREEDVIQIKRLLKKGVKQNVIANKFNIDMTTVSNIKTGRIWSNIGEDLSYLKQSKLKENEVLEIKALIKDDKLKIKEIANKFSVDVSTIRKIKNGKSWVNI